MAWFGFLPGAGAGAVAGLAYGFGKRWVEVCLVVSGVVPALCGLVVGVGIYVAMPKDSRDVLGPLMWGVLMFGASMVCTFIAWGACALLNHGARALYRKAAGQALKP